MTMPVFMYAASFILLGWGIAHLFPTRNIVRGFGEVSSDNKRIITMEWIIEGVTLVFIGALVSITTSIDGVSDLSRAVYWSVVIVLNILTVVSLFTGFRNAFIAFKLCPFIFTGSSILIAVGSLMN